MNVDAEVDDERAADEQACPFCGDEAFVCVHYAGFLNHFDGGFSAGNVCPELDELWDALTLAVHRAAAGGKIAPGKISADFDQLLQAAQRYGAAGANPEDAPAQHLRAIIEIARELADGGPGAYSIEAIHGYRAMTAEDVVSLFWTSAPKRYASAIKRTSQAVRGSVSRMGDSKMYPASAKADANVDDDTWWG
jgi:hypothetical protein